MGDYLVSFVAVLIQYSKEYCTGEIVKKYHLNLVLMFLVMSVASNVLKCDKNRRKST